MRYSPKPLSNATDADHTAWAFGALYAHVLCTTVTTAKIRTLPIASDDWTRSSWILSAFGNNYVPHAFRLTSGDWLFAAHSVGIRQSERDGNYWLTTLRYKYQWQKTADNGTWIVRWDYRREDDNGVTLPPEARGHIHFNGRPTHFGGPNFHKRHVPAGRLTVEDLVHFLITEGGCEPRSGNYGDVLAEAREIFNAIQGRG